MMFYSTNIVGCFKRPEEETSLFLENIRKSYILAESCRRSRELRQISWKKDTLQEKGCHDRVMRIVAYLQKQNCSLVCLEVLETVWELVGETGEIREKSKISLFLKFRRRLILRKWESH